MQKPKTWSLCSELYTLDAAVEGARILTDLVAHGQASNAHDDTAAIASASAVLELVGVRFRDLERMLRGEVSAEMLWAPHNDSMGDSDPSDVVFGRVKGHRSQ